MIIKIILLILLSFISGVISYYIYRLEGMIPNKYGLIAYFEIQKFLKNNKFKNPASISLAKFYMVYSIFFSLYLLYLISEIIYNNFFY